jgi:hypothetical protein
MVMKKPKAKVLAPDQAGSLVEVRDRRFDAGDWPIKFSIKPALAENWMRYFLAECQTRGWPSGGTGQLDARENSGSYTVTTGPQGQLVLIWERTRTGPLKIRARSEGPGALSEPDARQFLDLVTELNEAGTLQLVHCRGQLEYFGLPWCGELWLSDNLRLGPPSVQYETAMLGPRVIIVDAQHEGIDDRHALEIFNVALRQLSVFLGVIMETRFPLGESGNYGWTTRMSVPLDLEVRRIGYVEQSPMVANMPIKGTLPPVPTKEIKRPDTSLRGYDGTQAEETLSADTVELWLMLEALSADRRRQFVQAATMWQVSLMLRREHPTASFAWKVATCEALKPAEKKYRDFTIYDVVDALIGKANADFLKERWFRPQDVRNAHFHAGEFRASEFIQQDTLSTFQDPTFERANRILSQIAPTLIIEWLRRGGALPVA